MNLYSLSCDAHMRYTHSIQSSFAPVLRAQPKQGKPYQNFIMPKWQGKPGIPILIASRRIVVVHVEME